MGGVFKLTVKIIIVVYPAAGGKKYMMLHVYTL